MDNDKVWTLNIGCHRGTMMSRNNHSVTTKFESNEPLLSLEDCIACAEAWRKNYAEICFFLWYANAVAPDGEKHNDIVRGTGYR